MVYVFICLFILFICKRRIPPVILLPTNPDHTRSSVTLITKAIIRRGFVSKLVCYINILFILQVRVLVLQYFLVVSYETHTVYNIFTIEYDYCTCET